MFYKLEFFSSQFCRFFQMKDNLYVINELTADQRRVYIDAGQIYQAYLQARQQSRSYHGSMLWKKVAGKEYLYHYRDRYGHGKSLGPRSEETEKVFSTFKSGKEALKDRLHGLETKECRNRPVSVKPRSFNGFPKLRRRCYGSWIMKVFWEPKLWLWAPTPYMPMKLQPAFFSTTALMAHEDMDVLWDVRRKIKLVS